jgi:hypothetical protein
MEIPVIHVFTHDSIGVGEDGPTHQPIEHLISLRAIPNLVVLGPCDANEVAEAWRTILAVLARLSWSRLRGRLYCRVSSMILGLSSFPSRLCPAITARGLSDSVFVERSDLLKAGLRVDQAKPQPLAVEIEIPLWIRSDRRHMMYSGNGFFHLPASLFRPFDPWPDMRKPSTFWIHLEAVLVDFQRLDLRF